MSSRALVDKSITNIFWSYVSFFSTKLLNVIAIVIVARFLSPSEFGIMAFGLAILGYFELLQGFGLAAYLISTKDDVDEAAEAVFAFVIVASVSIFAFIWYFSNDIALFFDQEQLGVVLRWLSVALLIEATSSINGTLLQRELKFKIKVLPDVVRGLVKGCSAIGLALMGFGVWSLIYSYLLGTLAHTILLFVVRPWRPKRLPRLDAVVKATRYGSNIIAAALLNAMPRSLDSLLIGKFLGPGALGLYTVAQRIPQLALKTFGVEASKVIHPVMSQIQTDETALQKYYYGLVRYISILLFPAGAALAVVTEPLIHMLYKPEWYPLIEPMQIISIAYGLGTINMLPGTLYKAINRSDYFLYSSLINVPFFVVVMVIVVPFGIIAVAFAQVALVFVSYVPNFLLLKRAIGIEVRPTLYAVGPGVASMALVWTVGTLVQGAASKLPIIDLAVTGAAALCVFLATIRFGAPEILSELWRFAKKARSRAR